MKAEQLAAFRGFVLLLVERAIPELFPREPWKWSESRDSPYDRAMDRCMAAFGGVDPYRDPKQRARYDRIWDALRRRQEVGVRKLGFGPNQSRARAVARRLIEVYVRRGDSFEHLGQSGMGCSGPDWSAGLGSHLCTIHQKFCGGHRRIHVSRINAIPCCYIFSLRELYDEIRIEMTAGRQLAMF